MPKTIAPLIPPRSATDVTKEFSIWQLLIKLDGPTFRRRLRTLVEKARQEEQANLRRRDLARSF